MTATGRNVVQTIHQLLAQPYGEGAVSVLALHGLGLYNKLVVVRVFNSLLIILHCTFIMLYVIIYVKFYNILSGGTDMNDELELYKEMYLKMVRASEEALNILIKAQQECENMYINYGCSDGEEE